MDCVESALFLCQVSIVLIWHWSAELGAEGTSNHPVGDTFHHAEMHCTTGNWLTAHVYHTLTLTCLYIRTWNVYFHHKLQVPLLMCSLHDWHSCLHHWQLCYRKSAFYQCSHNSRHSILPLECNSLPLLAVYCAVTWGCIWLSTPERHSSCITLAQTKQIVDASESVLFCAW